MAASASLLRQLAGVVGPPEADVHREPLIREAVLREGRVVAHLGFLRQRRVVGEDLERHQVRPVGRAVVPQSRVVEDVEAVGAPAIPVLEAQLELMAGAHDVVEVARHADVGLRAIRIAKARAVIAAALSRIGATRRGHDAMALPRGWTSSAGE